MKKLEQFAINKSERKLLIEAIDYYITYGMFDPIHTNLDIPSMLFEREKYFTNKTKLEHIKFVLKEEQNGNK
jgi:hypothetical protein